MGDSRCGFFRWCNLFRLIEHPDGSLSITLQLLRFECRNNRLGRQAQDLASPFERSLDVRTNVFVADPVEKTAVFHHQQRMCMGTAQNQVLVFAVQPFVEIFQRISLKNYSRADFAADLIAGSPAIGRK